MILSFSPNSASGSGSSLALALASVLALAAYAVAAGRSERLGTVLRGALLLGWIAHALAIVIDIADIGLRDDGLFVDLDDRPMGLVFKLYPWEWMFHDEFGARLAKAPTRWIEPPWKALLSNKGILPLLWEMFPDHPNLLPAFFEDDPNAAHLGTSFVRKPLYSREGANVALVRDGMTVMEQQGPYGAEGFIRQAFSPLPNFSGQYPVIGSWLVDHTPCGLSIREDENPITGNTSRFLPHAIL